MNKIVKYIAIFFAVTSCNFLDVSDVLQGELTKEEVFNSASMTRRFHRYIYSGIPDMSFLSVFGTNQPDGLGNPWTILAGEITTGSAIIMPIPSSGYHAGTAQFPRWGLYRQIRQANQFLEDAKAIPRTGTDFISEDEFLSLRAEARFLRAYYHYLLFELYGPVPIQTSSEDPGNRNLDFYRPSVDEMVEFLDREFREVALELKEEEPMERKAAPDRGVALALRAKTWMYAASPLFNGGYAEAVALRDNTGKQIFPAKDESKWTKALAAMQDFIDFADGRYDLYKYYTTPGDVSTFSADLSLYRLFQEYNDEIIWATTRNIWGGVGFANTFEHNTTPRGEGNAAGNVGVTQELVDAFFMSDGLGIDESPLYDEEGFTTVNGDRIFNMYVNREPRFYNSVTYQGKRWQVSNKQIFFHLGSENDMSQVNTNGYTGYMLFKRKNRTLYGTGSSPRSFYRPSILYRLAEFYLLYAEALNEVNPSDPRVIEYIDKVRERAGIPLLADIKPEIAGNKVLQRKAIQAESRVELCTEGQRYFDVRRWMIAETPEGRQGGAFHGMDMSASEANFHKRKAFQNRIFTPAMYLYPIPLNEIQKSRRLVQNPGW